MKKNPLLATLGAAAVVGSLAPSAAPAAPLEVEPFNYPSNLSGSLNGLNGGSGWASAWSDADTDVTLAPDNNSLAYPAGVPLSTSGSRVQVSAANTAAEAVRNLGTSINLGTGGQNFYSSALFRRSAVAGESATLTFSNASNQDRWFYGIDAAGGFTVAVDPNPPAGQRATTAFTADADTTYLVVARIRTNTGSGTPANDEVFLKVFAPGDTVVEPATDAAWDIREEGNSGVTLTNVELEMVNALGQTNQLDEFRVGTSFADVTGVPEPGTLSVLGFGAVGLLARRRRTA